MSLKNFFRGLVFGSVFDAEFESDVCFEVQHTHKLKTGQYRPNPLPLVGGTPRARIEAIGAGGAVAAT